MANIQYNYRISAINSVGTSEVSNEANATTFSYTAPNAPTGLTTTAISYTQINLAWVAPAWNGGSIILGYKIERESPVGGGFTVLVANTGNTNVTYNNTGLTQGTIYNYRVSAINLIGIGVPSDVSSKKTWASETRYWQAGGFGIFKDVPTSTTGSIYYLPGSTATLVPGYIDFKITLRRPGTNDIVLATNAAQITWSGLGDKYLTATWTCPQTSTNSALDYIRINTRIWAGALTPYVGPNMDTEALGALTMIGGVWTITYLVRCTGSAGSYGFAFVNGKASNPSKIVNFNWIPRQ